MNGDKLGAIIIIIIIITKIIIIIIIIIIVIIVKLIFWSLSRVVVHLLWGRSLPDWKLCLNSFYDATDCKGL